MCLLLSAGQGRRWLISKKAAFKSESGWRRLQVEDGISFSGWLSEVVCVLAGDVGGG